MKMLSSSILVLAGFVGMGAALMASRDIHGNMDEISVGVATVSGMVIASGFLTWLVSFKNEK